MQWNANLERPKGENVTIDDLEALERRAVQASLQHYHLPPHAMSEQPNTRIEIRDKCSASSLLTAQ